jgi:hypothetical protein
MKTEVGRNWYQSINFDKLSCRQVSFSAQNVLRTLKTNVYVPLVMLSILGWKRTFADKTVTQNGSIDSSFDPPLFSLDSTVQ